ncbi:hypothetical protein, partial [Burkholderia sp. Bp8963]|uniref:hypothetical protein n=1 Tax=Burkholderia sp. Bp8963 TaxID=2184547 RepID=UPI001C8939F4
PYIEETGAFGSCIRSLKSETAAQAVEGVVCSLDTGPLMGVNASPTPSQVHAHDSGPPWLARPSTYETFIHNTLPV